MILTILIGIAIGLVTGVVAALCGVGGGIVMVPAFVFWLNLDQRTAVATSLAAIVLTAIAASWKNQINELIDWKTVVPTALAAAAVAWFAADWLKELKNETLTRIFAVIMIGVGIRMLFPK